MKRKIVLDWFKKQYGKIKLGLFIIIFFSCFLVIGFFICWKIPVIYKDNNILYLLSSISQGLAAAFALVFTITLVAVQMVSKYTSRALEQFFSWITVGLMMLFIIAIVFPWKIMQSTTFSCLEVKISIYLGMLCLVLLIPYLYWIKNKLKPETMFDIFAKRTEKVFGLNKISLEEFIESETELPETVIGIDNMMLSAYMDKDYNTFEKGLNELAKLGLEMEISKKKKQKENLSKIARDIYTRITNTGITVIDDPIAPFKVLDILEKAGMNAIIHKEKRIMLHVVNGLGFMGIEFAERKKKEGVKQSIDKLISLLNLVEYKKIAQIKNYFATSFLMLFFYLEDVFPEFQNKLKDSFNRLDTNSKEEGLVRAIEYAEKWYSVLKEPLEKLQKDLEK